MLSVSTVESVRVVLDKRTEGGEQTAAAMYRVPTRSGGWGRGGGRQWYVICFVILP